MVDSDNLITAFAEVLKHIQQSNFAELVLVIRNSGEQSQPQVSTSKLSRWLRYGIDKRLRANKAYSNYQHWDRSRNCSGEASIFEAVDCSDILSGKPEITVTPVGIGFVHRFPAEAVDAIKEQNLDVILRFGFRILRGDVLEAARYGVWSYHHGDGDRFRGGPPSFWELMEREPLTGAMLQVLTEKLDDGVVLAKTLAPTVQSISAYRNSLSIYEAAEPLVIQKLKQLHERGWEDVLARAPPKCSYKGRKEIYRSPTVSELGCFIGRELFDHGLKNLKIRPRVGNGYWRTGVRRRAGTAGNGAPWEGDWSDFRWVDPVDRFMADPQLIEHEGRTWMFVERFVRAKNRAHICCAELGDDGTIGPLEVALEAPYHLSLPVVFKHDGAIFMIPEAGERGRIELFRAVDFPFRWKFEHALFDMPGLDTVMHIGEDGGTYFFTSLRHKPHAHPNLFLFMAKGLFEPWQLHPASPLSLDARYSRNAGSILDVEGQCYRPSQDHTGFYGRQMHFHRIVRLNPREYVEELVGQRSVSPGWPKAAIGTHTYARTDKWEAVDGYFLGLPPGYE